MQYYLYKTIFYLLSLFPWWLIRVSSIAISWSLRYILKYRYRVVYTNLQRCFLNLNESDINSLAQRFYQYLVFQLLATPKLLSCSEKQIKQEHLILEGLEVFDSLNLSDRKACIVLMGHYGAWELFSAGQIYFAPLGYQQEQLYRPLTNKALDRLQKEMRSRFGSLSTPKGDIGRAIIRLLSDPAPTPHIIAFIADQTPRANVGKVWVNFLGQTTAFLDGAERIARKYDLPIVYMDVESLSDLKYCGKMKLITDKPNTWPEGEITRVYAQMLERTILRSPEMWLWSHRRWKLNDIQD